MDQYIFCSGIQQSIANNLVQEANRHNRVAFLTAFSEKVWIWLCFILLGTHLRRYTDSLCLPNIIFKKIFFYVIKNFTMLILFTSTFDGFLVGHWDSHVTFFLYILAYNSKIKLCTENIVKYTIFVFVVGKPFIITIFTLNVVFVN